MRGSVVRALVASAVCSCEYVVGGQWIVLAAGSTAQPAGRLLAENLCSYSAVVGTETTLGRRATSTLALALVGWAATTT